MSRDDKPKPKNQQKDPKRNQSQSLQEKASYLTGQEKCRVYASTCKGLTDCKTFIAKPPRDRYIWVRAYQHCIRCLELLPHKDNCPGEPCAICKKPHNTALHFPDYIPGEVQDLRANATKATYISDRKPHEQVNHVLATALIKVKGSS